MAKKVLVLGAGASKAYGYPLGGELRQRILGISQRRAEDLGIINDTAQGIREFTEFNGAFRYSQMYSIDAFLGRRKEFSDIGKKFIATVLLECEREKLLFSETPDKDHWYQYLFNQLAQPDWEELTLTDIAIVTFNYDRSLEHFLYVTLQSAYGKKAEEAGQKLKDLQIIHVYGSLCESLPGTDDYIKYDGTADMYKVGTAAKGIVVIPEGRADGESLKKARALLTNADHVAFLGFGFDPTNVERLAQGGACASAVQRKNGILVRGFYGTCVGIYELELKKRLRVMSGDSSRTPHNPGGFMDLNCTQLLRKTQFLE